MNKNGNDKLSYSWPVAAGLGIVAFAALIGIGTYSDVDAAVTGILVMLFFGFYMEVALNNRSPASAIEAVLTPDRLLTNDEVFGKGSGTPGSFAHSIVAAFTPRTMKSYDQLIGSKPSDLTGLRNAVNALAPKSLSTYPKFLG